MVIKIQFFFSNNMEFVNSIIQEEIAKNFDQDLKLRKGLPIGFFRKV